MIDQQTGAYECNEAALDRLTSMKRHERQALMAWLAKSGEPTILEAVRKQSETLYAEKDKMRKDPALYESRKNYKHEHTFAALIRAANHLRYIDQEMKKKRQGKVDLDRIGEIVNHRVAQLKSARAKKASPQRDKFRSKFYGRVAELRERGLSWRDCNDYMTKHHGCKFTHTWLRNNYEVIRAERILAGIEKAQIEPSEAVG